MSQIIQPADIEAESFAIITRLLGDYPLEEENAPVILRAIHTTADLDYAKTLFFSPGAVAKGVKALAAGAHIVTDTHMAEAGINKRRLEQLGGRVHCFISDEDVAAQAKSRGITRAVVAMEKAAALDVPCIFAIGNAPTALLPGGPRSGDRGAGGLCQRGGEQRAAAAGAGAPDRGHGPQGGQQSGRGYLQRHAVSAGTIKIFV